MTLLLMDLVVNKCFIAVVNVAVLLSVVVNAVELAPTAGREMLATGALRHN